MFEVRSHSLGLANFGQFFCQTRVAANTKKRDSRDMDTVTTAPIEYGRIADLDRIFGIKRSTAYVLLGEGKIKSRLVRHKGSTTGTRLIDFNSVREFLAAAPEETPKQISREMSRRGKMPRRNQEEPA
jgi:hypothetical protein